MRRSWAEQKDETWKANALHAHTHFCLTFESTSQVNSEAGVYGDAVVFMRLQQWQLWTEAACFHLSVWTSSPGNLFKSAPNIRLDSVMYLQNTSWSLLRTRRNRYSDYISHLVWCWSVKLIVGVDFQTVLLVEISESNGPEPVVCDDRWMRMNSVLTQRLREKGQLGLRITIIWIIDGVCNGDGVQEKQKTFSVNSRINYPTDICPLF